MVKQKMVRSVWGLAWLLAGGLLGSTAVLAAKAKPPVASRQRSWTASLPASYRIAFENGDAVLRLIRRRSPRDARRLRRYIGRRVAFRGGVAPRGSNADLMVAENVRLKVKLVPYRDVRPQAVVWSAWVIGTLKQVDYKQRVVVIEARPDDWHVGDTA